MKALLRKEFTLSLFPLPYCFWLLAGLLLIPNYPYFVTFFYATLGVMFLFQYNRENRDLNYMMTLPITKGQMVKARVVQTAAIELGMLVACLPFMVVRGLYSFLNNQVGFEANLALLGLGAAQLGIFNLIFLPGFYRDGHSIGLPFLFSGTGGLYAGDGDPAPHCALFCSVVRPHGSCSSAPPASGAGRRPGGLCAAHTVGIAYQHPPLCAY